MQNNRDVKLRLLVLAEYEKNPNISIEELSDIIKPHIEYDAQELIKRELKRQARRIIGSIRDADGVRVYFSNGRGKFVNIETTEDIGEVQNVKMQLFKKSAGLRKSVKKVVRREQALLDQMTLFDFDEERQA